MTTASTTDYISAGDDWPGEYFIDITPRIQTTQGDVFLLGTVRYRVSDAVVGKAYAQRKFHPGSMYFDGRDAPSNLTFEVALSAADAPQPMIMKTPRKRKQRRYE